MSKEIKTRGDWMAAQHAAGATVATKFDENALTFVVSSWMVDWQDADMGATPICFDHGALVPIVAEIVLRPGGDGANVYATGPQSSLETFAAVVTGSATPGSTTLGSASGGTA